MSLKSKIEEKKMEGKWGYWDFRSPEVELPLS